MPYSTAPVRHLPEINEGLPDRATAMGMVARPATRGLLSGNDAIDPIGQAAGLVGRHTFVQCVLREVLRSENLDTWVGSIAVMGAR
jgi:hypothetical protein